MYGRGNHEQTIHRPEFHLFLNIVNGRFQSMWAITPQRVIGRREGGCRARMLPVVEG